MNFEEVVEFAAQAAHEVNRVYCLSLGDDSQPHWEQAPDWQKDSAREGVRYALIDRMPARSHERWCQKKSSEGWSYGAVKDVEKKTHPCLVPFGELPREQKLKDFLFTLVGPVIAQAITGSLPETHLKFEIPTV